MIMKKLLERLRTERILLRSKLNVKEREITHSGVLLKVNDENRDSIYMNTIEFFKDLGYSFKLNDDGTYKGVGKKDDYICRISRCYETDTSSTIVAFLVCISHKEERHLSKEEQFVYCY